jgi:predicted aspartyl protease
MSTDTPRRARAWHLGAGALLALGLQWPAPGQAKCQLQALEIPVKMVGHRAIATVSINGTPVPLIVDSGAFYSFLTEAAAQQLNLTTHSLPSDTRIEGLTGSIETRITKVKHLGLSGGDLKDIEFLVGGNDEGGAMGLLGRNILALFDGEEFDLAHGMLRILRTNGECGKTDMAYWAGETPVSTVDLLVNAREWGPPIRSKLLLNGHPVHALFDTGATTVVSLDAAHSAGVKDADMTRTAHMIGAGSGKADAWTAPFDRVELGGEAMLHNHLEVGDFQLRGTDMLVGIDFFLSHHIYVSNDQQRMYFTYNGGPVFALNTSAAAPAAEPAASGSVDTMTADEHARRGAAFLARQDARAALADLDRACALEPGNGSFFATRARVHAALEDADATLQDLDTALRLDPGQADARLVRAGLRRFKGQREAALDDLSTLDKTLPPQAQIRQSMAILYETLDMPAEALSQWHRAGARVQRPLLGARRTGRRPGQGAGRLRRGRPRRPEERVLPE